MSKPKPRSSLPALKSDRKKVKELLKPISKRAILKPISKTSKISIYIRDKNFKFVKILIHIILYCINRIL